MPDWVQCEFKMDRINVVMSGQILMAILYALLCLLIALVVDIALKDEIFKQGQPDMAMILIFSLFNAALIALAIYCLKAEKKPTVLCIDLNSGL